MKVTEKVHGELAAARKAKRAAKAAQASETTMTTTGTEAKPKARGRKKADAAPAPDTTATPDDDGELVVFAFRLSRSERDAIHAAAGPARASKFVKGLAIAAAQGDIEGIGAILAEAKARREG